MGLAIMSCKIFNSNETQPITRIVSNCISSITSWREEENKDGRRVLRGACEEIMTK